VPALTAQCKWLDHSLYHLDGTQAIVHLDTLLQIEPLDAIEYTPQAGIETGGHKRWHEMYRRILAAGKSVQVVNVEIPEVMPLLDALGPKGVYLLIQFKDEREAEQVQKLVEPCY
jgi:ABC-type sugar transport system ATPase subunit